MSLAVSLIDQIEKLAKENNLVRVDTVELESGELKLIIPEVMQEAFGVASDGTCAQGATLKINEIKVEVQCRQCQISFKPSLNDFQCPQCQKADVDVLCGNDIILKSITGQTQQDLKGDNHEDKCC